MPVSPSKIALLHVAKRQLQLTDGGYRAVLRATAGVSSAKELDEAGFEAVLAYFAGLGFQSKRGQRRIGPRLGMATDNQIEYLRGMWAEYTGRDDERSLNRWLENRFGVTALRFLDEETVGKAIVGLKRMLGRRATERRDGEPG